MNDTLVDELKEAIGKLRTSGKSYKFVYFKAAEDGEPLLLVKKKIKAMEITAMRKAARKKVYVTGFVTVNRSTKNVEFYPDDEPPRKMEQHIKMVFAKRVPHLKRYDIKEAGTLPDEVDTDELVREAQQAKRQKTTQVRRKQYVLDETGRRSQDKIQRGQGSSERFERAERERDNLAYRLGTKQTKLEEAERALSEMGFMTSKSKKTTQKQEISQLKLDIANYARQLQEQQKQKNLNLSQMVEARKALDQLEVLALELEEAELELQWAEVDLKYAETVKTESDVMKGEKRLDRALLEAAEEDPVLKQALVEADQADRVADEAMDVALGLARNVSKLEEKLEEFLESGEDDPLKLAKLESALEEAEKAYADALEAAEEASETAEQKQRDRDQAISFKAASDKTISGLLDEVTQLEKQRDRLAREQEEAERLAEEREARLRRHQEIRSPQLMLEGSWLTHEDFELMMGMISPSLRGVMFDTKRHRIGIGYDPLLFIQKCKSAYTHLYGMTSPLKTAEGSSRVDKLVNAFGTPELKLKIAARRRELAERGREVTESFDWDELDDILDVDELDELDDQLSKLTTPEQSVDRLLGEDGFEGICLGEGHRDTDESRKFLFEQMERMIGNGVDTLYIEQITSENQDEMDEWLAMPPGTPMPDGLLKICIALQSSTRSQHGLIQILEKAQRLGLNVQCIDTTMAKGDSDSECSTHKDERVRRMLGVTHDKFKNDTKRRGKFVCLVGTAHAFPHEGDPGPVPGIGELLGVPSVKVGGDTHSNTVPHLVRFEDAHPTDDPKDDPNPRKRVLSDDIVVVEEDGRKVGMV